MEDYKKIALHFGFVNQLNKWLEEVVEVKEEFDKMDTNKLIEELTDTLLLNKQLIYLLQGEEKSKEVYEKKVERTIKRMKSHYYTKEV